MLGTQRTKIWLIHGMWTKPLVHGLPWTWQAVLSQCLQHRNFQTMNLEDPASRSASLSSSNSASASESLFAFFDPSSTSALFSSSYSAPHSGFGHVISKSSSTIDSYLVAKIMFLRHNKDLLSQIWNTTHCHTYSLSVLSSHGAVLCCTEQSVQSADSRDSTVTLDNDNVPHTKSVRTRPVFFFHGLFWDWSMDHGPKKVNGVHGPHGDPYVHCAPNICPRTRVHLNEHAPYKVHITEVLLYFCFPTLCCFLCAY